MSPFMDYAKEILAGRLKQRQTIPKVVDKLKATPGLIGFYPCSRLTREILCYSPELWPRVVCFDKAQEVNTIRGIKVYNLNELSRQKISLLVVCSTGFYARETVDLPDYQGKVLNVSRFETTLPDLPTPDILRSIEEVYQSLADEKSRATYLITWLSRLLNDEKLTFLFQNEGAKSHRWSKYSLSGIDGLCRKELFSDIYQMKHVFIGKGDTVLDVGAYKGDTAVVFSHAVGKGGIVYCFEPIKANFEILLKNIRDNNLPAKAINRACSDETGKLKMVSLKGGAPWSFVDDSGEEVETITLDDFAQQIPKVDYIKIDVQGWEHKVILGAKNVIGKFAPKLAICIHNDSRHLIDIPLLVLSLGNYSIYTRCKIEGAFGIILFAVQNGKTRR